MILIAFIHRHMGYKIKSNKQKNWWIVSYYIFSINSQVKYDIARYALH